ncbi:MAG TPA: 30S ribosome-binding factor RbfA [Accumulibacter sp.]|uniref:30S ribosome-binding factor RbfA n=1 Tax=Accumulibacter sp. TaxID=2053492 RepID=UPI002BC5DBDB|nr:30S ribosome-binding factor RbfA [Accumulibacter sp.]HMW18044.1 30S ribosome-binding factor RbfA [Accumulibacter sp.]HMX22751.1 30S ribosome-binding factor RbfA [Accumulibacter sp.]HMY06146.1 30S ribosome-binding factor RbfA [Accumulibacter sp.]HNC20161.1 30S ribosome-binding factor RbfA [Accumulibacter sp.]HND80677.1 30S ribosome-binding factor RbfA [Accumulibacter sp.]
MAANKGFARRDRISEQLRRELAELLRTELRDPRVGMISLTDVHLSPDYAHAKVFFSTLAGSEQLETVQAVLDKAAGFLRGELGKRIRIHTTPQLHFVFDDSLERGAQLTRLIGEAVALSGADQAASAEPSADGASEPVKPF